MSASPPFSFLVLFLPVLPHHAARQRVHRLSPPPFRLHVQADVPQLKEMCSSLSMSKELVKALVGIWGPDDGLNPSTASLLSALGAQEELEKEREMPRLVDELHGPSRAPPPRPSHPWRRSPPHHPRAHGLGAATSAATEGLPTSFGEGGDGLRRPTSAK
uniref:Uncharacterized protein n=1 Tax=Oryza glumipatula TaxID=40148 RepID=A0A0E0B8H6_9ORYZ